jgi:cbb3-type cytochrome c oxidase subunit III
MFTLLLPALVYSQKDDSARGQKVFQQYCVGCHGSDGRSQTEMGKKLEAADLASEAIHQKSESELLSVVKNGKGKMPAWNDKLDDKEIRAVVAYVRQLH